MFGLFKKKEVRSGRNASTLVPRIKNDKFLAAARALNVPENQLPWVEPLVADLFVAYAFDLPELFQMASADSIKEARVALSEARATAIGNLKRLLPNIGCTEPGILRRIVTGENLEACTLLAATYWDDLASQTEGDIVAAVPTRDIVLFCGSRSKLGLKALSSAANEEYQRGATHALTNRLITWRMGRWQEFLY